MKASELVKHLNKLIEINGDHEVVFAADAESEIEGDFCKIASISIGLDEYEKPYQFMICDKETALSFI